MGFQAIYNNGYHSLRKTTSYLTLYARPAFQLQRNNKMWLSRVATCFQHIYVYLNLTSMYTHICICTQSLDKIIMHSKVRPTHYLNVTSLHVIEDKAQNIESQKPGQEQLTVSSPALCYQLYLAFSFLLGENVQHDLLCK